MLNSLLALSLAGFLAAGFWFQIEELLLVTFSFATFYAGVSYWYSFKRAAGLVESTLAEPDQASDMFWMVYISAVAVLWDYNQVWAALLFPWTLQMSAINIMSYLVYFEILAILPKDEDDEEY